MDRFDLLIIGSGPAGQSALFEALTRKKRVALVERENFLGGVLLHGGTIPSKALREAILTFYEARQKKRLLNLKMSYHPAFWKTYLLPRVFDVVKSELEALESKFHRSGAEIIWGEATLLSPHEVRVAGKNGEKTYLTDKVLLTCGTKAAAPVDIPFDQKRILDSDHLFLAEQLASPVAIFGSGVIALEYASMLIALGLEVELYTSAQKIFPYLDTELSERLLKILCNCGLKINYQCQQLQVRKALPYLQLDTEKGSKSFNLFIYASGRIADIDSLRLKEIGVELNEKGFIRIDRFYRTSVENIYAAGDVAGAPATASAARIHGRRAVRAIFGAESEQEFHLPPAFAIYTIPEIAFVGLCPSELEKIGRRYITGRAEFSDLSRAKIEGETTGFLKLIFCAEKLVLLGAHALGARSSEIIHLAQMAIQQEVKLNYFLENAFNYPTYGELFQLAALNAWEQFKLSS